MTLITRLLACLIAAMTTGCAMTPVEVAATEPVRQLTIKTEVSRLTACLMPRLENLAGPWTASYRTEGSKTTYRIHAGSDMGTIAVAAVTGNTATIHISHNILTKGSLAGILEQQIAACDLN